MAEFCKHTAVGEEKCCPACGTNVTDINYRYTDGHDSFLYVCQKCSFIFARPLPIIHLEDRHLEGTGEMRGSSLLKTLYKKVFIDKEIREIKKQITPNKNRLLDVACGTGWTTACYKESGFDCIGIEPSPARAEYAEKQYGLKIIQQYFEECQFSEKFDLIIFRHIIEHFEDPRSMLKKATEYIDKDGCLLVIVPNINSLGRYLFGTKWSWVLPIHCNFFTPKSIKEIINNTGFEVVKVYQTPSPFYLPEALSQYIKTEKGQKFFKKNKTLFTILLAPFSIFGSLIGMGDTLNVIAKVKTR